MREDGSSDQALKKPKGTETKTRPKDREERVKSRHGPTTLREDEDDDLSDGQELIDHSPNDASHLVWNGTVSKYDSG